MRSLIISVAIALSMPAFAGPVEVVKVAFGAVVDVVKTGTEAEQATTICTLVGQYVDLDYVGNAVLGQAAKSNEKEALAEFKTLINSIIATDLMLVATYFQYGIEVDPKTVPRAGGAKGVRMTIEISKANDNYMKFIVVVNKNLKIGNLEFVSFGKNMIDMKKQDFKEIMEEVEDRPVAHLVDVLRKDSDLVRCP